MNRGLLDRLWQENTRFQRVQGYLSELVNEEKHPKRPLFDACAMLDVLRGYEIVANCGKADFLRTPFQGYGHLRARIERLLSSPQQGKCIITPLGTGCGLFFSDFLEGAGLLFAIFLEGSSASAVSEIARAMRTDHEGILLGDANLGDDMFDEETLSQVTGFFDLFETACEVKQAIDLRLNALCGLFGMESSHLPRVSHGSRLTRIEDRRRMAFLISLMMELQNFDAEHDRYALDRPFPYPVDREAFRFFTLPAFERIVIGLSERGISPAQLLTDLPPGAIL